MYKLKKIVAGKFKSVLDIMSSFYKKIFYKSVIIESIADNVNVNQANFYAKLDYKVAIICDEIFMNSLYGVVDLEYITPQNYEEKITEDIDLFLIVSSWRGLENEWRGMYYDKEKYILIMQGIIDFYKSKTNNENIVFYSKEDPVNYNCFREYSKIAKYVFTTAQESVPLYMGYCSHSRVDVLKFAFNPNLFNPSLNNNIIDNNKVVFAGSWMRKYPERCNDLKIIFDGLIKRGKELVIIDRNSQLNHAKYMYPLKYTRYCRTAMKHDNLNKLYANVSTVININSIKNSHTMFAGRVYELLAMGKLVLSNDSLGMSEELPEVFIIRNDKDLDHFFDMSSADKKIIIQSGIDNVFNNHTMYHRIEQIMSFIRSHDKKLND